MAGNVRLRLTEIHALCFRALSARGLNERAARLVSESMTTCEASGSHSHGLFRLQGYCEALSTSRVDGGAEPVLESPAGAAAVRVDARGAFAPAALAAAVPALTAAAKRHGVAACAIRDSHHFGALWPEAEALAERGLLSLATVNSKAFVAHPAGGPAVFGTNPIAFGCPRRAAAPPLVWDQACSAMARGDVSLAARDGRRLRPGVGLDRAGAPSADPRAVLAGVLLPFGAPAAAHKGANLALMVELLAAALTRSPLALEAAAADPDWYGPTRNGQLLLALDPAAFGDGGSDCNDAFFERVEALCAALQQTEGARLPGVRRAEARARAEREGVQVPVALHREAMELAAS